MKSCRKAWWLQAREALWSNCKRAQPSVSTFFPVKGTWSAASLAAQRYWVPHSESPWFKSGFFLSIALGLHMGICLTSRVNVAVFSMVVLSAVAVELIGVATRFNTGTAMLAGIGGTGQTDATLQETGIRICQNDCQRGGIGRFVVPTVFRKTFICQGFSRGERPGRTIFVDCFEAKTAFSVHEQSRENYRR